MGRRAYSTDLRARVVAAVAAGCSRRAAADRFEVSPSSAIRIARQDWKCQPTAAGRQEPLAAGGPCALVVGAGCQGARFDTGGDGTAASRGSWSAHDGQLGRSILEATRIELQKKLCTPPSKSDPTWRERGNFGRPVRLGLMPSAWCSLTRPELQPRWFAPMGAAAAVGG